MIARWGYNIQTTSIFYVSSEKCNEETTECENLLTEIPVANFSCIMRGFVMKSQTLN